MQWRVTVPVEAPFDGHAIKSPVFSLCGHFWSVLVRCVGIFGHSLLLCSDLYTRVADSACVQAPRNSIH